MYLTYFSNKHKEIIEKFKQLDQPERVLEPIPNNAPIWVMWWQGEEQMPSIVKSCYNSIKKHAGNHPVKLITGENYQSFVNEVPMWDSVIVETFEAGRISIPHLSDLLRHALVYHYGGLWIDATLLLNCNIDEIVGDRAFVTGRVERVSHNVDVAMGKWTSFFFGAGKNNILCDFIYSCLLEQIKKTGKVETYFAMDYFFTIAYNNFEEVRNMVSKLTVLPDRIHFLLPHLNDEYVKEELDTLLSEMPYYKLSYKGELKTKTRNGKETIYSYLINTKQKQRQSQ